MDKLKLNRIITMFLYLLIDFSLLWIILLITDIIILTCGYYLFLYLKYTGIKIVRIFLS